MTSDTAGGFSSPYDPYWTAEDYVRFTNHRSADVRLWALERLEELGLEISGQILRRLLDDVSRRRAAHGRGLLGFEDRDAGAEFRRESA